jgi:hypothetical protein
MGTGAQAGHAQIQQDEVRHAQLQLFKRPWAAAGVQNLKAG